MADVDTTFTRAMGLAVAECTRLNGILAMNRTDDPFWQPVNRLVYIAGKSGRVGSQMPGLQGLSGDADMADAMCLFNGNMWVPSALGAPANVIIIAPYKDDARVEDHDYGTDYTNGEKFVIEYRYAKVVDGIEWDDLEWVSMDGWDRLEVISGYVFDNGVPSHGEVVTGEFVVEDVLLAIKDISKASRAVLINDNESVCGTDHTTGTFLQGSELFSKYFYIDTTVEIPPDGNWTADNVILSASDGYYNIFELNQEFVNEHFGSATRLSFFTSGVQFHRNAVRDTNGAASSYTTSLGVIIAEYDGTNAFFGGSFQTDSSGGGTYNDYSNCVQGGGSFTFPGPFTIPIMVKYPKYNQSIQYSGAQNNYFNNKSLVWTADVAVDTMFSDTTRFGGFIGDRSYRLGDTATINTHGVFRTVLPVFYLIADQGVDLPDDSRDYFNSINVWTS